MVGVATQIQTTETHKPSTFFDDFGLWGIVLLLHVNEGQRTVRVTHISYGHRQNLGR